MRDEILMRVRQATAQRDPVAHPGDAPARGDEAAGTPLERFEAAFTAAGGELVHFADSDAARSWAEALAERVGTTCQSTAVPSTLRLDAAPSLPEDARLGVSLALGAAADTGSLVLGGREGRRVQLLPRTHLVWVPAERIHPTLAAALAAVRGEDTAVLALHSGPSKSADIGQVLVRGVHGPARVIAAVVGGDRAEGES